MHACYSNDGILDIDVKIGFALLSHGSTPLMGKYMLF